MSLSAPFIKRPVATFLLTFGILLGGYTAYRQLPVASLPAVDFPTVRVYASLPGASPETMASSVATPLERQLGQIAEVNGDQDFGSLLTKEGGLLYFHRNSVLSGDFDHLSRGDEVHYNDDIGDTGPIATKVRVKERR